MADRVMWRTAPPLWHDALAGAVPLERPAVLRFDTDDFMTRLQAELDDQDDRDVRRFVLRPETWRSPAAGGDVPQGSDGDVPRLYHPSHGRFYLVTGGLVCARYGLPDKVVHPGCGETAFYVLRRLEPVDGPVDPADARTYHELGWVPSGSTGRWVEAAPGLVDGEERLPLFPLTYRDGHRRRVLAGLVPVSARQRYEDAVAPDPVDAGGDDPAAVLALPGRARLETVVVGLQALRELAASTALQEGRESTVAAFREAAFFALVDLASFLADELPQVWAGTAAGGFGGALVTRLTRTEFGSGPGSRTWLSALRRAHDERHAVLADLDEAPPPVTGRGVAEIASSVARLGVGTGEAVSDPLFGLVHAALGEEESEGEGAAAPASAPSAPSAPAPPRAAARQPAAAGALYAARLVYERPRCRHPQRLTLSEPTAPFRLAHLYDPDAPFRDNRIVLPVDTSLEGLRKYPQAVTMELSAQLRRQMDRVSAIKLGALDDGDIPDGRPLDLGMVCSLSIPIITICALVLLMIIVSLLNIVFFWIPLFKICLPRAR